MVSKGTRSKRSINDGIELLGQTKAINHLLNRRETKMTGGINLDINASASGDLNGNTSCIPSTGRPACTETTISGNRRYVVTRSIHPVFAADWAGLRGASGDPRESESD